MSVDPPERMVLISTGDLDGIFSAKSNIRASMTELANRVFHSYRTEVFLPDTYQDFCNATFNLSFALKQGFDYYVNIFNVEPLLPLLHRIVVCAYLDFNNVLCVHFGLLPENVNKVNYIHIPFTDLKH